MMVCAQCGAENPERFRFCGACGAPFMVAEPPRESRKVVTALFCDVTGSTSLGERLDPEVLRGVLNRYFAEIRAVIERHGGTVDKFIGDAVMAVFGIPRLHEDDALRAVRAAAEIREQLPRVASEVGVELRFRMGVNTGPVLMGEGEGLVVGDAMNVAARLEQTAEPGEIVIGQETLRLVRDAVVVQELGRLELEGKTEPVPAFRLLEVDPGAPGISRRLDVPLVGRKRELRLLREAWADVVHESRCHLFTLLGVAGVGKSRLVAELLSGLDDDATILRGRCLEYGEGITFGPLVEALMALRGRAQHVLDRLRSGGVAIPEELFWEVRRLLEALASERPLVLHIDDLQWAEQTLLDLLDHVADLSRGAPILLLCTARPELLEDRPVWGGGKLNATALLLEPLAVDESEALLDRLGDGLGPEARARVISASEGNPLFLEEMAALARERGTVEVPPTIRALLTARLERLGVDERQVLERGAIEGEIFHRLAVEALAGGRLAAEVESCLAGLVRKELIRPHPAMLEGEEAFRFRHVLIRDAAYDALPKASRAELHERFATWLEQHGTYLLELDEIAGWHLEQAVRYRLELGRDVDPQLPRNAARHLYASGTQAASRRDATAVRNLLERALALAARGDALHSRIAVGLAETLVDSGDFDGVEELLSVAEADPNVAPYAALIRLDWLWQANPEAFDQTVAALLPAAISQLELREDYRGLAKAHLVASLRHVQACRYIAAATETRTAHEYARRAGDEGLRERALGYYLLVLPLGPTPTSEMAREYDEIERGEPGPLLTACLDQSRGALAGLRGDFDEARFLAKRAGERFEALGQRVLKGASMALYLGEIELRAGNPSGARSVLLEADAILASAGERGYRSGGQAMLALAYEQLGERDAARAAIELAEALSAAEDLDTLITTSRARVAIALAEGDLVEADRWARTAAGLASKTDFIIIQGETKLDLARVLAAAERQHQARVEAQEALALFQAKSDQANVEKARAVLAEL
jgi:class 3 adenylate cyclase